MRQVVKRGVIVRSWLSSRLPFTLFGRVYVTSAARAGRLQADTMESRRERLADILNERSGSMVQTGLFTGTVLPPPRTWRASDYPAMLLGTYERELHNPLRTLLDLHPDAVINLGCANGLYAAGLARQLPGRSVIANDIAPAALAATAKAWELNRLADTNPLELSQGMATFPRLSAWLQRYERPLVVCDIEGGERGLLDPAAVPQLAKALLICELHRHVAPGGEAMLAKRFAPTHRITYLESESRDPHTLPMLADVDEHDRWLAVSEGRHRRGRWMIAVPNNLGGA